MKRRYKLFFFLLAICLLLSLPELFHTNSGISKSTESPGKGAVENPWLLPYRGANFRYFSPVSYYLLNRGYVHNKVHDAVMETYAELTSTHPDTKWRIMECSPKNGGKMWPHRTHQNGMSIDFMVPKTKKNRQHRWLDRLGVWHYGLSFDKQGKWSENVRIDFEAMGQHILALDAAARNNGLRIKKVLLKIDLKNDFYATDSGAEVRRRGIYLAMALPKRVDDFHDDHYHVDFAPTYSR